MKRRRLLGLLPSAATPRLNLFFDPGPIPSHKLKFDPTCTDARLWAEYFVAHVRDNPAIAIDPETMTSWFASALMAGWDEGSRPRHERIVAQARNG